MRAALATPVSGLDHYRRLFGPGRHDTGRQLDRGSLPTPERYLRERGLLTGKPRGGWASIICPAHKAGAEAHPSLRVALEDGHFRCMTCGARGGDLVALHRLLTGAGFIQAVRELGGRFHD